MSNAGVYRSGFGKTFAILGALVIAFSAQNTYAQEDAQEMKASLADPAWNGEAVPDGQQCQRFGGTDPRSPTVRIENIPAEAEAIILEFSDRSFARMDEGGHGKVGYLLDGDKDAITVPPVPGHTEELPEGFFVAQVHRAPGWDKAGAYLPPCSGGRGNVYFVDIKAVTLEEDREVSEILGETSVQLGKY